MQEETFCKGIFLILAPTTLPMMMMMMMMLFQIMNGRQLLRLRHHRLICPLKHLLLFLAGLHPQRLHLHGRFRLRNRLNRQVSQLLLHQTCPPCSPQKYLLLHLVNQLLIPQIVDLDGLNKCFRASLIDLIERTTQAIG